MMQKLFGKKEKPPTTNDSIQRMNDTLETVDKREAVLQRKIDQELAKAKEASAKKNKALAMQHLKRKKQFEEQLDRLVKQKENIEHMQMKLEEATINVETIQTQQAGANAIRNVYARNNLTIEKIDETVDKVRETIEQANEISAAISQPLGGDDIDEDELMNELELLEAEEMEIKMMDINVQPSKITTPNIAGPAAKPKVSSQQKEEEDLLAELEAQLA
jgi:charged multivesicular body protein 4